jgi:hypothetical protein
MQSLLGHVWFQRFCSVIVRVGGRCANVICIFFLSFDMEEDEKVGYFLLLLVEYK